MKAINLKGEEEYCVHIIPCSKEVMDMLNERILKQENAEYLLSIGIDINNCIRAGELSIDCPTNKVEE